MFSVSSQDTDFRKEVIQLSIGDNIKNLRKQAGFSQKELAAMIGQTPTSIMHYEKGDRTPNQENIEKIATALKVRPSTLLDWDDWENRFNHDGKLSEEVKTIESIKDFYGDDAVKLLQQFHMLNDAGKEKILSDLEDLTMLPKYLK